MAHELINLHDYDTQKPYYLGIFLIGAYQETLGDIHNLFGDTHFVHLDTDVNGKLEFKDFIEGDTVKEVLTYVQFDIDKLLNNFSNLVESAVKHGKLDKMEAKRFNQRYARALDGYTYLVVDKG